jgi:ribonuclease Z
MDEMAEATFHSTTLQAAKTALDAGAGRLLIGHYSSRFPDVGFYLDEVRSVFPEAELSGDLAEYEIPLKSFKA